MNTKDNIVYIGDKEFLNYVTAVMMQFSTKKASEVIIKSRGKFVSKAVDVAEVTTKRFMKGETEVKDVKIDSAEFTNKDGKQVRVSSVEITLVKK